MTLLIFFSKDSEEAFLVLQFHFANLELRRKSYHFYLDDWLVL